MTPHEVTVFAEIVAKPGREEALQQELLALVKKTREEKGCIQYDLHVSVSEPGRFLFYENWKSGDALTSHAASAHLKAFADKCVDLCVEPARVIPCTRIA
jgi:quinol monooxygenase YgiN